jgi:hypothetical protein
MQLVAKASSVKAATWTNEPSGFQSNENEISYGYGERAWRDQCS